MLNPVTENKINRIVDFINVNQNCKYFICNKEEEGCGLIIPFLNESDLVNISINVNAKLGRGFFMLNQPFEINATPTEHQFICLKN